MSSEADLAKIERLEAEKSAAASKLAKAKSEFAGKLGSSLIKALGGDDAVKLVDAIASSERSAIPADFVQRISAELATLQTPQRQNGSAADHPEAVDAISENA